ncbi:unnamed protein product [Symbiodinium pilosum]|uniref:Uncharacterized protein n=1 Tax=Symbiodinium pilosum TaxID=2952 RepID=A0A812MC29_SYMPI|nr:unnamed protein product [Symbiodinium pilosum]
MSRNLFETETLAFAAQLGPASEFLGGFGGHQQPGGREQRAESLAFSEGLGESAGKAAACLMLLPVVQADSDKLASVHKTVQALSAALQGKDDAMKNFQQKLQHLETLLEEKAAKIDALSAESAEAAATTFSKAATKALSKGVVALQEEASEKSPKKHKGDDKCGTVTEKNCKANSCQMMASPKKRTLAN